MPVELERGAADHAAVYRDFHAAIANGTRPLADGAAGRMSLELANAIIYSSHTRSEVELPLDRHKYATLLEDLRARR
jgi:predicted dehydrogenase